LWPDWICKILPGNYTHRLKFETHTTVKKLNSLTKKFPCVCEKCNNGWMNEIEKAVRPVLQPMILGRYPKRLTRHNQRVLARWMSLRCIVHDAYMSAFPHEEFHTQQNRYDFAASDAPLPNARAWIARASEKMVKVKLDNSIDLNREGAQIVTLA